jgi:sugar phosphate isomerase/epimerase
VPGDQQHGAGAAQRRPAARADRDPRQRPRPGRRPALSLGIEKDCAAAGIELWVEAPHFFRLCYNLERAQVLTSLLHSSIGLICDVSHIVASGSTPREFINQFADRIRHVHLRDAEPGYIHHSIGNGQVDFADTARALAEIGYTGKLSLELETRDISNDERPQAALKAGRYISSLL